MLRKRYCRTKPAKLQRMEIKICGTVEEIAAFVAAMQELRMTPFSAGGSSFREGEQEVIPLTADMLENHNNPLRIPPQKEK